MILHPVIVSRVANPKNAYLSLTSLNRILSTDLSDPENKNKLFRTRFCVLASRPSFDPEFKADSVLSFLKLQNTKTEALSEVKANTVAKKDERLVFACQLLVQDYSTTLSN
jgi:hypothetical protein